MDKPKCIYKCTNDGKCARSTCQHHCQVVTDETCNTCMLHQDKLFVSKETRLKNIIKESIALLEMDDMKEAKRILNEAMKI